MSNQVVESITSSKESYFLNYFSTHKCDHDKEKQAAEDQEQQNKPTHGPEPTKADINYLLDVPLSSRSSQFYEEESMDTQNAILNSVSPWRTNPNYFQTAHISSLALLKMSIHARSGGSIEVMGMLTGKIVKHGIVVMDVYPLPVEGTETRVNALSEGYEFMVDYLDSLKKTGRNENIVGWYHSHPGYGCWLSGIDVGTQSLNQRFQDPYLAIVVDPERTIAHGKVEIGAFRTYPQEYVDKMSTRPSSGKAEDSLSPHSTIKNSKDIPAEKIKDFGMHTSHYYSLKVEIFRSELEECVLKNLWNKYWVTQFIENEQKEEITEDKMTELIQERLNELNKKIEIFKKSPYAKPLKKPTPGEQQQARAILENITSNNPLSLLTNSQLSPFTRNNFFNGIGSSSNNIQSAATSPHQRNSKDIESDVGESDSEMNDAEVDDSDSQFGDDDYVAGMNFVQIPQQQQQQTKQLRAGNYLGGNGRRRRTPNYRKDPSPGSSGTGASTAKGEGRMSLPKNEYSGYSKGLDKSLRIGGLASRELINLKLQEILFLNEKK